ncbi:SDR family NAD(P)-dependent oxidoreductase [Thermocoleostomius sinensis]|uniref:SDR family NAD(P)-dependent oxidoreductase n=1 Tax=Thermocoleostomius sinensis A174 TaxID=2016057 RepID=A0A9E8ZD61_9CYAN|nr:SDR family NAD(P)-dependent oxidoreductase [Thermocoleostomius sinensis]WAL59729.1 SDR family NAD(P)-dependent oxidoreductase [Thermocoleostomius sinensis A174]
MDICGKVALVTGASRGIGRSIALELAKHGARRLLLVARNVALLSDVAAEIEALGAEAIVLPLDLTQTVAVNVAIAQAWRSHGPIDLLINCAGVAHQTPFLQTKLPQVQEEIAVNLLGMYTITRVVARRMAARKQGKIVNVSSLMGKLAAPTMATYSATKFAIQGFTQALRAELLPHNVQVISLLPTLTSTDMIRNLQLFRWVIPMTPEQVARSLIRGLHRESPEILVGWQSHLAVLGSRIMPWLTQKLLRMASPLSSPRSSHYRPRHLEHPTV